ncbi:MAG: hypothetical protein RR449_07505 [Christensenella sp.]
MMDKKSFKNALIMWGALLDGMMVEAAPSAGGVVYREVSVQGTPIIYARPHI